MRKGDAIDHALRTLLAEKLGGATPPDLAARIRARAQARRPSFLVPADGTARARGGRQASVPFGGPDVNARTQEAFVQAMHEQPRGLVREFYGFMAENAKWWMVPFLIVFALLGAALVLGSTGAAPFIYTMF